MKTPLPNRILRTILPPTLGALGGIAWWYFAGCASGSCPITSRWWTSALYGLLAGATFLLAGKSGGRDASSADDHSPST